MSLYPIGPWRGRLKKYYVYLHIKTKTILNTLHIQFLLSSTWKTSWLCLWFFSLEYLNALEITGAMETLETMETIFQPTTWAAPTPTTTATPRPLTWSGRLRTRQSRVWRSAVSCAKGGRLELQKKVHTKVSNDREGPLCPKGAFPWLKATTTAFTFKNLLRHYANQP